MQLLEANVGCLSCEGEHAPWSLLAKSHLPCSSVEKGKTPLSLLFAVSNGWKDVINYSFNPLKDVQIAH